MLLHKLGHRNQYQDPAIREVAFITSKFTPAALMREPLPRPFALLEPLVQHVPSLRFHLLTIQDRIEALSPEEQIFVPPNPEIKRLRELRSELLDREPVLEGKLDRCSWELSDLLLATLNKEQAKKISQGGCSSGDRLHFLKIREYCERFF